MITSVYQYFDNRGKLLYVGVTNRGIRRLHEHAESKEWWPYATGCTIEHLPNRDAALDRERFLISTYRPVFNKQHNPDRGKSVTTKRIEPEIAAATHRREINHRRRDWYALSPEVRKSAACVRCGIRPGVNFPECVVCRPPKTKSHVAR